ncbi:hypothetical protein I302_106763 [Kwoniella bestiolae CBS 10118]|uniref:Uncharacterized protein n=1 Tax=Kwoniella bestiolae CBS 10118 TaxID=1296100 RepID=A0A1B9G0G5_9TREE|nr:hypothetical protein I302_05971 [Kwoniella bestiolae CBS 10118]OCF24511.1 hypothetical protein I302_05971 [Kwoniella bestiolae CBS 10118]
MMGFKKKLTSFLPSDATNRLQNVLTVEWEGQGKTVLVELPDTQRNENNEVEMAGLTSSAGAYGRLNDDDEDERSYSRPSRSNYNSHYTTSQQYSNTYYESPSSTSNSKHKKHPSYSSKTLPPLPPSNHVKSAPGNINRNPFEPEYHSPQPSSSSTYSYSSTSSPYAGYASQFGVQQAFDNGNAYGNEMGGNGSLGRTTEKKKAMPNPWGSKYRADDIDLLGDIGGTTPNSSGMREDGGRGNNYDSLENPFR